MPSDAQPDETPLEVRAEWTRLRQIMYEPSAVWLLSEAHGFERWLTDQFVMLRVTDSPALASDDEAHSWGVLPDGPYKLTAGKGFVPRESPEVIDLDVYFEAVMKREWFAAEPSEWSVAEHPGKAQLWVYEGCPALLGEPTWTQLKRHHPEAAVEYNPQGNVFRLSEGGTPFCFAAGIQCPDGQLEIAHAIARGVVHARKNAERDR